jgi:hypothetical protein
MDPANLAWHPRCIDLDKSAAAADEVHDLNLITVLQTVLSVFFARDNILVDFDGDPLFSEAQFFY